jgi:hypothetical protein
MLAELRSKVGPTIILISITIDMLGLSGPTVSKLYSGVTKSVQARKS